MDTFSFHRLCQRAAGIRFIANITIRDSDLFPKRWQKMISPSIKLDCHFNVRIPGMPRFRTCAPSRFLHPLDQIQRVRGIGRISYQRPARKIHRPATTDGKCFADRIEAEAKNVECAVFGNTGPLSSNLHNLAVRQSWVRIVTSRYRFDSFLVSFRFHRQPGTCFEKRIEFIHRFCLGSHFTDIKLHHQLPWALYDEHKSQLPSESLR